MLQTMTMKDIRYKLIKNLCEITLLKVQKIHWDMLLFIVDRYQLFFE